MMPGGKSVFPTLTVRDNLRLACWLQAQGQGRRGRGRGAGARAVPAARRAHRPAGRQPLRRRAADAGRQPGAHPRPAAAPHRRAVARPGADDRRASSSTSCTRSTRPGSPSWSSSSRSTSPSGSPSGPCSWRRASSASPAPPQELLDRPDILRSVFIAGRRRRSPEAPAPAKRRRRKDAPLEADRGRPTRRSPRTRRADVLECDGVVKRFGGITAVDHVDLQLREGQILGLIGQNGAGKTTLFDCVSGFLPVDGGRDRASTARTSPSCRPHERAARGLGRSFQEARLFPSLTTAETLAVARERHLLNRGMVAGRARPAASPRDSEDDVADEGRLPDRAHGPRARSGRSSPASCPPAPAASSSSPACWLAIPSVIVLDEPSGGVAQKESEALGPAAPAGAGRSPARRSS